MAETKLNGCIIEQCGLRHTCTLMYGSENPPCAKTVVENVNSVQQLQAKIAACVDKFSLTVKVPFDAQQISDFLTELRQLSAVQ